MAHLSNVDGDENSQLLPEVRNMSDPDFPCDFKIKTEKCSFPVHRTVISSASKYFSLLFSEEKEEAKQGFVEIKEVSSEAVRLCIRFMYNRETVILLEDMTDVVHVAKIMQLHELADKCFKQLKKDLSANTCIIAINLLKVYGSNEHYYYSSPYERDFQNFILKNFEAIVDCAMFPYIDLENLMNYMEFFSAGKSTERIKWEAITKWTRFDCNRREHFPRLFKTIEFDLLDTRFVEENIQGESLVKKSEECMRIVREGMSRITNNPQYNNYKKWNRHQQSFEKVYSGNPQIACFSLGYSKINALDINTKKWHDITSAPDHGQWKFGIIGNKLFVLSYGGQFFVFDNKQKIWNCKESVKFGNIHESELVEFQGKLFGVVKHHTLCYDPILEMWEKERPPGCRLRFFSVASSENHIFAIGGAIGTFCQWDQVRRYDPQRRRWAKIASMRSERWRTGAACLREKLYVMGGCWDNQKFRSVECYDPSTNAWTGVASMCLTRENVTACVLGDKLYAVGGAIDKKGDPIQTNSIELYDPITEKWEIFSTGGMYPYRVPSCIYIVEEESPLSTSLCKNQ